MRGKTQRPKYEVTPMVDMNVLDRLLAPRRVPLGAIIRDEPVWSSPLPKVNATDSTPSYVHKAADWYRLGGAFVPQVDGGAIVYNPKPGLHEIATGIKLTEPDRMTFERLLTTASIYRPTNPTESAPGGVVGIDTENRTYADIKRAINNSIDREIVFGEERPMGELKAFPSTAARNTYDDTVVRGIMQKNGGRITYADFNAALEAAGLSIYRGSLARHRLDIKTQNFPSESGAPIVLYTDAYGRSKQGIEEARRKATATAGTKTLYVAVVDNGVDSFGNPIKSGLAQKQFASFIGTDKVKVTEEALEAARQWECTSKLSFGGPHEYHVHIGTLTEEVVEPEPQPKWETVSLRTGLKTGGVR